MCDEFINQGLVEDSRISRRTFGFVSIGAAIGTAGGAFAQDSVVERDVEVKTADGQCDAVLFHPAGKGTWPAVLVWTDIMGLRPVFREMGRRLASQGYVVLVPNPFYRSKRAPVIEGPFDFGNADQRAVLFGYMEKLTPAAAAEDSKSYLAFLDAQSQTNKSRKAGVQGYCMGGGLSLRTAAANPERIAAVATFHGGNGMASDKPDSPHRLIAETRATFLICAAQNDDAQQPQVKELLKSTFAAADRKATVEVFPADHGWCVKGGQAYDQASAERAWSELSELYKSVLV